MERDRVVFYSKGHLITGHHLSLAKNEIKAGCDMKEIATKVISNS